MRRGLDVRPADETVVRADLEQEAMFHSMRLVTTFRWTVFVRRFEDEGFDVGNLHLVSEKVSATFNARSWPSRARANASGHRANGRA
jgi:hypothetical protein